MATCPSTETTTSLRRRPPASPLPPAGRPREPLRGAGEPRGRPRAGSAATGRSPRSGPGRRPDPWHASFLGGDRAALEQPRVVSTIAHSTSCGPPKTRPRLLTAPRAGGARSCRARRRRTRGLEHLACAHRARIVEPSTSPLTRCRDRPEPRRRLCGRFDPSRGRRRTSRRRTSARSRAGRAPRSAGRRRRRVRGNRARPDGGDERVEAADTDDRFELPGHRRAAVSSTTEELRATSDRWSPPARSNASRTAGCVQSRRRRRRRRRTPW